jgi:predicted regulator of Ras-like GTPase activity (Roadblock/LC7/MglB family)
VDESLPVTDRDLLQDMLIRLRGTNGVVASTVISRDGIPIASDLPPKVNPDILALRTAFMQGIGELVMESMEDESARTVIIVAKQHYILTTPVDESRILVVVLERTVDVGAMLPGVLETAASIRVGIVEQD